VRHEWGSPFDVLYRCVSAPFELYDTSWTELPSLSSQEFYPATEIASASPTSFGLAKIKQLDQ